MEQLSAAKETLEKVVLCDDYWARPESPARELLTAIERGEGARLVHSWAEANRAKCKVNEKDSYI
jgi:tRNA U54 and U55 pseudouridine synthase Pus10